MRVSCISPYSLRWIAMLRIYSTRKHYWTERREELKIRIWLWRVMRFYSYAFNLFNSIRHSETIFKIYYRWDKMNVNDWSSSVNTLSRSRGAIGAEKDSSGCTFFLLKSVDYYWISVYESVEICFVLHNRAVTSKYALIT